MKPDTRRYLFDVPGLYRIRILGRIDASRSGAFGCMTNCASRVRGNPPTTTLTGTFLDQACLINLLCELYDMGYPLLDVKRLAEREQDLAIS